MLEVLIVLVVVSILSALLLPAFVTVRARARQTTCVSNLEQIGVGISMYISDYDSHYPRGVDAVDRLVPPSQAPPQFVSEIPAIPDIQTVLLPYLKSPDIFRCPADVGFMASDFPVVTMDAFPSSFEKYGSSYFYRTELAARRINDSSVSQPAQINVMFDGVGEWHGTLLPLNQRYNVLFADGHVKNISRDQIDDAWQTPLSSP